MNPTHNAPCQFLEWDSNFMELRIARVLEEHLDDQVLERIYAWCRQNTIDCLYFLANADDAATIQAAIHHDFDLAEIRLNFEQALSGWDPQNRPRTLENTQVRQARNEDIPVLQAIAQNAYVDSRFYADRHFRREQWQNYYMTWVKNSVMGGADFVLVAEIEQEIQGYVTGKIDPNQPTTGHFALAGVRANVRKAGIGQELMRSGMDWFVQRGVDYVWTSTQGRNIASQRMLQRTGFVTRSCQLYFHKWLPEETGQRSG